MCLLSVHVALYGTCTRGVCMYIVRRHVRTRTRGVHVMYMYGHADYDDCMQVDILLLGRKYARAHVACMFVGALHVVVFPFPVLDTWVPDTPVVAYAHFFRQARIR
jgi:hypothetical protein